MTDAAPEGVSCLISDEDFEQQDGSFVPAPPTQMFHPVPETRSRVRVQQQVEGMDAAPCGASDKQDGGWLICDEDHVPAASGWRDGAEFRT